MSSSVSPVRSRPPFMSPLTLRHKLPSHVFASHHLRGTAYLSGRAQLFRAHALTLRVAASAPLCFFPPDKTEVLSRPCLRISPASAVCGCRSEHAFGIFLPRFIRHQSHPHLFCSQFVHKKQDSRKPCPQFASALAARGNAKQKKRNHGEQHLHSSPLLFPKFTKSPSFNPVASR